MGIRMRGWPQPTEKEEEGESVCSVCVWCVQYNLALWFLSRGHVANFPTDGIHFLYFTFPWTPPLRSNFAWLALSLSVIKVKTCEESCAFFFSFLSRFLSEPSFLLFSNEFLLRGENTSRHLTRSCRAPHLSGRIWSIACSHAGFPAVWTNELTRLIQDYKIEALKEESVGA